MDQSKALKEAMDDVTSTAEQLRLLQQRINEHENASDYLKEVSDTLTKVCEVIENNDKSSSKLLSDVKKVAAKADEVKKEMKEGVEAIKEATLELPKVFERIDNLDISKTVDKSISSVKRLEGIIKKNEPISNQIIEFMETLTVANEKTKKEIVSKTQNLIAATAKVSTEVMELRETTEQLVKSTKLQKNIMIVFVIVTFASAIALGNIL